MSNDCSCFTDVLCNGECRKERFNSFFKMPQSPFWRQVIASSCGTTVAILTLNPITVVKVRLQNSVASAGKGSSVLTTIRRIAEKRGISGFWAGTSLGMVMSVPNSVLYMTAYEQLKANFVKYSSESSAVKSVADSSSGSTFSRSLQALSPGLAGALARGVSVTAVSPLELIRTIQTGGVKQPVSSIALQLVKDHGVMGLYRGWWPSIMRDCPFSGIYWFMFEAVRGPYSQMLYSASRSTPIFTRTMVHNDRIHVLKEHDQPMIQPPHKTNSVIVNMLSGATAGTCAAALTHPFDVLKTQQQIATLKTNQSSAAAVEAAEDAVAAAAQNLRGLYAQGGLQAMYRGLTMRLVTVIPASAIMVTIYEGVKTL